VGCTRRRFFLTAISRSDELVTVSRPGHREDPRHREDLEQVFPASLQDGAERPQIEPCSAVGSAAGDECDDGVGGMAVVVLSSPVVNGGVSRVGVSTG
jgi:hypothetical protein